MNSPPHPSFNLLHEPWIPVRLVGGGPVRAVGLRELLLRARDFGRIDDPSPLITVALLRLSLALAHRALLGPKNADVAAEWFRDGFPAETLEAYFASWHESFDLFHPEKPFWQVKAESSRDGRYHWSLLSPELNGSNTTVLFGTKKRLEPLVSSSQVETGLQNWLGTTSAAHVARLLVQNQNFALGGRTTGTNVSQQGGPVMSKALFVPQGGNLLATLCLNMLPYSTEAARADRAVWEWQHEQQDRLTDRHAPLGLADRYTWLSRGITVFSSDAEGKRVSVIGYGAGVARVEDENRGTLLEPMAALVSKKVEGQPTLLPLGLSTEKLAWRDIQAILPEPQDQSYVDAKGKVARLPGFAPPVIQNALRILGSGGVDYFVTPVHVFGQILGGKPGITSAFREECYAIPIDLIMDWERGGQGIDRAFKALKDVAAALERATLRLATEVLSRGGEREPEKKDISALARSLPGLGVYWAALEAPFRVFLSELDTPDAALGNWKAAVTREARRAWELNLQGAGGDGQVHGFAYRPRRTDGKHQPSPQRVLDRALGVLNRPPDADTTPQEAPA